VVQSGENLWRISQRYGTTVDAIARANQMADPTQVSIGQRLYIPAGTAALQRTGEGYRAVNPRGRTAGDVEFFWPVRGTISSGFGSRDGAHHDGIDIPARKGTSIRAAEAGRVVHSSNSLAGYGNMVILKHTGAFSTVYAHNRKNLVRVGQFVDKGDVIAEVGDTGRASAPHVHFEIRHNGSPRNPVQYLP
jgi:murein DD-endopeptidase MepM/ murein hydrolase activator NlpD